jgi:hypothetical protein
MIVNFRARRINQGVRKLTRTPTLIKQNDLVENTIVLPYKWEFGRLHDNVLKLGVTWFINLRKFKPFILKSMVWIFSHLPFIYIYIYIYKIKPSTNLMRLNPNY